MSDIALPAGWEAAVDDQDLDTDHLVRRLILSTYQKFAAPLHRICIR
jgi:hypothetical protein